MGSDSLHDHYYQLWVLLSETRHTLFKARTKELKRFGVLARHSAVLTIIKKIGDKATPAEISRWLSREPHSISGILDRMEKDGLVKKIKDLPRRNMVRVAMTEKGEQAYKQSIKREVVHRIVSGLSEEQRRHLSDALEILWARAREELKIEKRPLFPPPL